jgi:hypothetical protein
MFEDTPDPTAAVDDTPDPTAAVDDTPDANAGIADPHANYEREEFLIEQGEVAEDDSASEERSDKNVLVEESADITPGAEEPLEHCPDADSVEGTRYFNPLCKVCRSPNRDRIEELLLLGGLSRPDIAEMFPDENLNRQNLSKHALNHMELVRATTAEAVRARTAQAKRNALLAAERIVSELELLDELLAAGMAAAKNGGIRFTAHDLIVIAEKRSKLAAGESEVDIVWRDNRILQAAAQEVVPVDMWGAIHSRYHEKLAEFYADVEAAEPKA